MFQLHERLAADSHLAGRAAGCQIRLVDDARYFWLLLVPEVAEMRDLHDLPPEQLTAVMRLAAGLGRALQAATRADKINTAAIGNMVPQLHIHVVARHRDDAAWPQPVWGAGKPVPLPAEERTARLAQVGAMLRDLET
ncbi:MAG: HIT family protein [Alphaproteobacteria bacterium]